MAAKLSGSTLQVENYRQFMALLAKTDRATSRALRNEIREAGYAVRDDSHRKFLDYETKKGRSGSASVRKTAAGYRVIVRQRGVDVEQALRKTTGLHPEFGTLQMRKALVPALDENKLETARAVGVALDRIAARFND